MGLACVESQNPEDENDLLVFALEIECACNASTSNVLERLICFIAIERPSVFTRPRPFPEIAAPYSIASSAVSEQRLQRHPRCHKRSLRGAVS